MPDEKLTIHDLVDDALLNEVLFFEVSARKPSATPARSDEGSEVAVAPVYELSVATSKQKKTFRVRLKTSIDLGEGNVIVDSAIEYELTEQTTDAYNQEILLQFAQDVGLMALLPFVRQAIADLTQRVFGSALLLPMVKRGQFQFTPTN